PSSPIPRPTLTIPTTSRSPSRGSLSPKPSSASAAEMAVYFFDSSALVKRHVSESGSAWVRSLTRAKAAHTLYIARITAVEITSAITRRQPLSSPGRGNPRSLPPQPDPALSHPGDNPFPLGRRDALSASAWFAGLRCRTTGRGARSQPHLSDWRARPCHLLVSADQDLNAAATDEGLAVDDPSMHP